jgi:hypothetical protein
MNEVKDIELEEMDEIAEKRAEKKRKQEDVQGRIV